MLVKVTARKWKQNHLSRKLQNVLMDIGTKLGDMNCFKYNGHRVPRFTMPSSSATELNRTSQGVRHYLPWDGKTSS